MSPHRQVLDELRTPTEELLGVAVLMDGGTASVYAPPVP
jgi:hypothetical protein